MKKLFKSGTAKVRKARHSDIEYIVNNIRESDKLEVWASDHLTPKEAMEASYKDSVIALTIEYDGKPIGMFGVVPYTLLGEIGTVWLLGTNEICNINKKLLKRSRDFIKILLNYYPRLENYVDSRNTASIKWLKFCGAKINPPEPYGPEKVLFHKFMFERDYVVS